MKEQLISFETAKLARKKGFNIPTRSFYPNWDGKYDDETLYSCQNVGYPEFTNEGLEGFGDVLLVPTQSLLQKWLRDRHNIIVSIDIDEEGKFFIFVTNIGIYGAYNSWEEALETSLKDALTTL